MGGLLDVVIAPGEVVSNDVTVNDVGLSDHMLIHWSITVSQPGVEYNTRLQRRWFTFNIRSVYSVSESVGVMP